MATRIEQLAVLVPANTAIATPQTVAFPFREGNLEIIELAIPPGPSGLVGFAIFYDSQQIIPFQAGTWFIMDDDKRSWPVQQFPTGSRYKIVAYNTDVFDHTLNFTFLMNELPAPTLTAPALQLIE